MARNYYIVALVLTAQLVEVLLVILGTRVALDRHVTRRVVCIVVVEADWEVITECFNRLLAHE